MARAVGVAAPVQVARGKQFAKRATMWDALFVGISATRRDEGVLSVLLRIAFRLLVNLTFGLFMAVLEFLFSVWRVRRGGSGGGGLCAVGLVLSGSRAGPLASARPASPPVALLVL